MESKTMINGYTLEDYRNAVANKGPLAYEWSDKPHRLVYDLINEIERLRAAAVGANVGAEMVERVAKVLDPLAFGEWTTPPRGWENSSAESLSLHKEHRQRWARKKAKAAIEASGIIPEVERAALAVRAEVGASKTLPKNSADTAKT